MFEGFIRNGHSGELALDDIRLGTDIPLENCMGTYCCVRLQGWGWRWGQPGLESLHLQAASGTRLPYFSYWEFLDLSWGFLCP